MADDSIPLNGLFKRLPRYRQRRIHWDQRLHFEKVSPPPTYHPGQNGQSFFSKSGPAEALEEI